MLPYDPGPNQRKCRGKPRHFASGDQGRAQSAWPGANYLIACSLSYTSLGQGSGPPSGSLPSL